MRQQGPTGEILLRLLEQRLDNVVYRAGWASTRPQARQFVSHGLIQINGKRRGGNSVGEDTPPAEVAKTGAGNGAGIKLPAGPPGRMARMGAKTVVAATLRAVQLLGRQFVLGQTMKEAQHEADIARKRIGVRFSYDMLGEGARTDEDALRYLQSYSDAIDSIAARADKTGALEVNDGISIKLSALHPRYEDAQSQRVMDELMPRVWGLCQRAAAANINLTIDAEEVDRLELSLQVLEELIGLVAQHCPQWRGLGLAMQSYQTRAFELIEHITRLSRQYKVRLMCRLGKGAYWDAEIKRAQELGADLDHLDTHQHLHLLLSLIHISEPTRPY